MSSALLGQVRAELTAARKNREAHRTLLFSTLLSEFGNHEIALGHALSDAEALEVVLRAIKRRKESIDAYRKGGRTDLVDRESAELAALEKYLPPAVGEGEIRAAVKDAITAGAKDMGAVMGRVMPAFKGRADGKLINQIVREELAAQP